MIQMIFMIQIMFLAAALNDLQKIITINAYIPTYIRGITYSQYSSSCPHIANTVKLRSLDIHSTTL